MYDDGGLQEREGKEVELGSHWPEKKAEKERKRKEEREKINKY